MNKVTVLYNHPTDPETFEKYYAETHIPMALKIKNLTHAEFTKFIDAPGAKAAYYRMAELCFKTADDMQAALASPEGQAAANDLGVFATGGVSFLLGSYETS